MSQSTPGFLAFARSAPGLGDPDMTAVLRRLRVTDPSVVRLRGLEVALWGYGEARPTTGVPLLLSRTNWSHDGFVAEAQLGRWIREGAWDRLGEMLPPFGALGLTSDGARLVADPMGFRQVFTLEGPGWTALSTSALALGALTGFALDSEAVGVQSQLGWQLGQRTLWAGVTKLRPRESVDIVAGRAASVLRPEVDREHKPLDMAVDEAASILRSLLDRYLDEAPDATLQLTGGQDSRIILSAIPPMRRRGLKAMTLAVPGSPDAEVAAALAARFGMRHTVRSLDGLEQLTPDEAFDRVCAAARRLDCMADPLARAATLWAEERLEQGHRLSGLGGEIARGFYYTGRVQALPVTRARSEQLARWRMFANEAVERSSLHPDFAASARSGAMDIVHEALQSTGRGWYDATDDLYYRHRMQRWAGLGETAVCFDRTIINPMLDDRFLAIAEALTPREKRNSQFLGRLQVVLDRDLAGLPLDNRAPPNTYAHPGPLSLVRQRAAEGRRATRKVRQRLAGAHRPPPGGGVLAGLLLQYLRDVPDTLEPLRGRGIFDEHWLDGLGTGADAAEPSSLALVVNLLVALGPGAAGLTSTVPEPHPLHGRRRTP